MAPRKPAGKPASKAPRKPAAAPQNVPDAPVTPSLPADLSPRAESFWRKSAADFELTDGEVELLTEAAYLLTEIDGLRDALARDGLIVEGASGQPRVHPAVNEVRQHRMALARMLKQLDLPAEDEQPESQTTQDARKAANARWDMERKSRRGA
jgi:hypothetical protein